MEWKFKVLLGVFFVLAILVFAFFVSGVGFSVVGQDYDVLASFYSINDDTYSMGWLLGSHFFKFGPPRYVCDVPEGDFVLNYPDGGDDCWAVDTNSGDERVGLMGSVDDKYFRLVPLEIRGKVFCEGGECRLLDSDDWRLDYGVVINDSLLELSANSVVVADIGESVMLPFNLSVREPKLDGGISLEFMGRFLQSSESDSVEILGITDDVYPVEHTFVSGGLHVVKAQGFIEVFDHSLPLVSDDTGLCVFDGDGSGKHYCLQKSRVPVGKPVYINVYVRPKSCTTDSSCGGDFGCVGGVCELKEGIADEPIKIGFWQQYRIYVGLGIILLLIVAVLFLWSKKKNEN